MKKLIFSPMLMIFSLCFFIVNSYSATVEVDMKDFRFDPPTIHINVGDTVKWENKGIAQHTTTSGTNCTFNGPGTDTWDSGLLSTNQTFERTFDKEGTFPYFCIPHCVAAGMVGTVIVGAGGETQKIIWSGSVSFPISFISTRTDDSENKKFTNSKKTFKGTIKLITQGDTLLADEQGCFVKFLGDNGTGACIEDKAFLSSFNAKSRADQLSLIGTGAGNFSEAESEESEEGPVYLDTKGTFRKNRSGNIVSIDLNGKIAGGDSNDEFVFSGNFRSKLTPAQ